MPHHAHAHHQHPRDNHRVRNAHELYKAETVYNVVYVTAAPTFDGPIGGYKTMDGSNQQQAQSQQPSIAAAPVQSSSPPANAVPAVLALPAPANSPSPSPETQAVPTTPTTSPAESTTAIQPTIQPTIPPSMTPATISTAKATSSSPSAVVSSVHETSKTDHSVPQTLSEILVPTNSATSSSPKLETPTVVSAANAQSTSSSIPATSESASGGMSGGAKAGLAIGILLAIGALAGLIFFCLRRRRNHRKEAYSRASDEKAGLGSEGAAVGLGRSASVQTSKTFATAPRLSLRPVTQFLPDIAAQRKSGNNFAAAAGPLRHNAPMSQGSDAEKAAVDNCPNDPTNPFGNHAEMSEKESFQRNPKNPTNPFGNHAQTDRQLTEASAEPEVIPPAPLRIRTPTPDGKAVAIAAGAAAVGVTAGEERNVPKPLNLSPNRAASPAMNGMPSPTASDFSTTPVSPGTFPNGPPPSNVHRIQLDFKPSMDDELELRAGQLVRLLHEYDDGWALCIRLDRSQQGVAPRTCLSARPVKPRPPPGARGPPPRGPPPPGMFSNQQRPASPANGRGSPRPYNRAPRPSSPSPAPSQRSMSPGPYGGGRQRPTIPSPGGKRRSNSAGAVRERRNSPVGPSPMNPNVQRVPMQLQAVTAPGQFAASRIANTQPTYDIFTGTAIPPSVQPLQQSLRQSQSRVFSADIGNEDLRAQIKALQYEVESLKQEREYNSLRHEKEVRDAQIKAEADYKRAQASESSQHVSSRKYEALSKELKETQDKAINYQQDVEKKLRLLQEENRSLKEDVEESQTELSSLDRQHRHQLQGIEAKHATLQQTLNDLRTDLENKTAVLNTTQEKLSEEEAKTGDLESENLRLKAQNGDADIIAVIKRELSDQVTHIRKLESTSREQNSELKHLRRIHKAVEVVEEEKRVLQNKVALLEDLQKELREAQLQRQILEDERQSWTSYLQNQSETGPVKFSSPEDLARTLVRERVETASLAHDMGVIKSELLERDGTIASLEEECSRCRAEIEKLKSSGGGNDNRAKARLERQKALAVKEVECLREQLKTFDSEEITYHSEHLFDAQKQKRIQDLESLVDQHRGELQTLNNDLSAHDNSPAPSNPLKRPREPEDDPHLGELSRKNRALQDTLSTLQRTHAHLQSDHQATTHHLTALQSSSQTRILALRANPTADAEALKLTTLTSLRTENAALLAQLESPTTHPPTEVVPLSTLHNARLELSALAQVVADKEKRMLRLKQIWTLKSLELREAVASLLGYQMDFVANGKFRLTSIFHPGGEEGGEANALIFDGETGTMKIAGGNEGAFAREIRPLIKFWVEERGEIPALMAAWTLEAYERSTRAARV